MTHAHHTPSRRRAGAVAAAALLGLTLTAQRVAAQDAPRNAPGAAAPAGDEVLVGRSVHTGGYGAPDVRLTRLSGDFAVLVGARGGWIVNHAFRIGAAGYANASRRVRAGHVLPSGRAAGLELGYGGVDLGWVSRPGRLVHLAVGALVGGGAVSYNDPAHLDDGWTGPRDAFFVAEPTAEIELNVTRSVRVAAGGSYRFVTGARLAGVRNADLRAPSGVLAVKFGRF